MTNWTRDQPRLLDHHGSQVTTTEGLMQFKQEAPLEYTALVNGGERAAGMDRTSMQDHFAKVGKCNQSIKYTEI